MARIIPVVDVMGGHVVRAVGGRRAEYRPWASPLCNSSDPTAVADALCATAGGRESYVADLDAIQSGRGVSGPVEQLTTGFDGTVWLDAGARSGLDVLDWPRSPNVRPVVASETVDPAPLRPATLDQLLKLRPAFSLDLRDGVLIGEGRQPFGLNAGAEVFALAEQVVRIGFRTLIVIDLASVGERRGPSITELSRTLRRTLPGTELIVGGGVRNWDDVKRLEDAGVDGVLVATALHGGTLTFPRPAS